MSQRSDRAREGAPVSSDQLQAFAARGAAAQEAVDQAVARVDRKPPVRLTIPLEALRECPWNPRTTYDKTKIDELAQSLREVGLLEPIVARVPPGVDPASVSSFEIVCGHRRFRAAKIAGLADVAVEIHELDDGQALEIQLVENVQRADLSPIEEARGYRRMIDVHGLRPEAVAQRVGVSRSTLYERLRLLELPEKARRALLDGVLSPSTAGLIVRIADPRAREKAAADILAGNRYDDRGDTVKKPEPLSFRAAARHVRENYLLDLAGAGWDLEDAELVAKAGACALCPKRTGNMAAAGDEVLGEARPDVCTDAVCFKGKLEAFWVKRSAEHEEKGGKLVPEAAAKRMFPKVHGPEQLRSDAYVDLEEKPYDYQLGLEARKSWRQLLKGSDVPVQLVRGPSGRVYEVAPRAAAEKVAKSKAPKRAKASSGADQAWKKRQATAAKKAREERGRSRALLEAFRAVPVSDWQKDAKVGARIIRFLGQVLEWESMADPLIELGKLEEDAPKGYQAQEKARKELRGRLSSESGAEAMHAACELALACALQEERTGYQRGQAPAKGVVDGLLSIAGLDRKKAQSAAAKLEEAQAEKDAKAKAGKVAKVKGAIDKLQKRLTKKAAKRSGRKS